MLLRPQRNFTIVRQIANHLDTTTYYVRAVIRDAYTDEILATLNLDDKGGQRFTKNWQVSPDPSGLGREISIVTSVYTDSGYTTKSENYGDEENSHLIEENIQRGGGGGGVDYYTLRKIIQEELDKLPKPEPFPDIPTPQVNVRLDSVLSAISELKVALKPETPEKVDFAPLMRELYSLRQAISEKEVTPETDISPVLQKLMEKDDNDEMTRQELVILLNQLEDKLVRDLPEKIATMLNSTKFEIAPVTAEARAPEKKPELFDISKLAT
jgi:hypothetical protein